MTDQKNFAQAAQKLYPELERWWHQSARDFPWRFGKTTAWGVLLSEVMSQQTPMTRVLPYWLNWMNVWPTPAHLAQSTPAEVITAWGTLGYPRRALRLRECAQAIVDQYEGKVPDTYDDLVALPGIGDYTASAVLAFHYHRRVAVIDTNIRRVLSRSLAGEESRGGATTAQEKRIAQATLPQDVQQSVTWNQATMELGATVCTAKNPQCAQCPLESNCAFVAAGFPGLGEKRTRPKQSFQGTNRQVRGLILKALRHAENHKLPYSAIQSVWENRAQLDECIASLDEDGLIIIAEDHSLALP
ncbi:HhH-GPD family protein [Alloscardovia criceti]|uniref:A/G-specific adenine glycosylase n=1 Tax=Alloscardovia criceti TaxID=356828 RepID=UPI0003644DBE|nr:A/G-specific adenine glycosylase [Alloscardovia criceti]